jgi:hypothetical protein
MSPRNRQAATRSRFSRRLRFHRQDVEQTIRSERLGVNTSPHSTHGRGICATTRRGAHPPQNRRGRPRAFRTNGAPQRSQYPSSTAATAGAAVTSRTCPSPCRARGRTTPRPPGHTRRPETPGSGGTPANRPSPHTGPRSGGRSIRSGCRPASRAPSSAAVGRTCRGCPTSPSSTGYGAARTCSPRRPGPAHSTAVRPVAVGCRAWLPPGGCLPHQPPRDRHPATPLFRKSAARAFLSGTARQTVHDRRVSQPIAGTPAGKPTERGQGRLPPVFLARS